MIKRTLTDHMSKADERIMAKTMKDMVLEMKLLRKELEKFRDLASKLKTK
jgi:hypothetical protein